ncbi:hypothetical protein GGR51DRAFT_435706 [Nemania sp. FL0031]|nr:hypothetical protein GGR51DRAFT_435706 [Nemania sp. FL0031]
MARFLFPQRKTKVFTGVRRTELDGEVINFDPDIVEMVKACHTTEAAKVLLDKQQGEEKMFMIGARISNSHASLIIQELDLLSNEGLISIPSTIQVERNLTVPFSSNLRQLHIRLEGQKTVLAVDIKTRDVVCERYIQILTIRTTWKHLQYLYPESYSIVLDDCATFCSQFVKGLLNYFVYRGDITQDEAQHHNQRLGDLIIIADKSASAEAGSRRVARPGWNDKNHGKPEASIM